MISHALVTFNTFGTDPHGIEADCGGAATRFRLQQTLTALIAGPTGGVEIEMMPGTTMDARTDAASASADTARRRWLSGPWSQLGGWVALLTFAFDQAHKWWMILVYRMKLGDDVYVTPFLNLHFTLNKGVSYGLFSMDGPQGQWALAGFAILTSLALWLWLAHAGSGRLMAVSLGLIIGGALGNALDRLTLGGVADFFLLHAFGYSWYVFNIADVAIVAGVAGLLYESFVTSRNDAAKVP